MASKLLVSNLRRQSSALLRRCAAAMDPPISEPLADEAGVVTMKGVKFYGEPFYLDNLASTPLDSRVLDAMHPYQPHLYGNPHSRTHKRGWDSAEAVEKATGQVAELIGATANDFTSGATESNNLSIIGVMHFYKEKKKHVITLQTEHKCVKISGKPLYLDMQATSLVDPRVLDAMLPYYIDRYGVLDVLNGSAEKIRYPDNLNLSFAYVEGESLLMGLKEVTASLEPSYVLRALGVDEDMADTSIRFGIGRFNTEEEIDRAVELVGRQVERLREMSPHWEMVQENIDIKKIQWSQHGLPSSEDEGNEPTLANGLGKH